MGYCLCADIYDNGKVNFEAQNKQKLKIMFNNMQNIDFQNMLGHFAN